MPVTPPQSLAEASAPTARPASKSDDPAVVSVRPPMPEISARTEFSGPLLRQIREAIGVELREIAEKSKIGMAYLQALEGEVFAKLPAPVYVRGFLVEYARALGLDAERVKQTYLDRYRAARGPVADHAEDEPAPKAAKP
jgi:transcriptional regulator with XRE-family HTH domain